MTPDDRVARWIAEAAHRRAARQRRRAALDKARRHGLAQRHAAKLRHLAQDHDQTDGNPPPAA